MFDVQAVAAMMSHGLSEVYTFNLADFHGYAGIQPTEPPVPPTPIP